MVTYKMCSHLFQFHFVPRVLRLLVVQSAVDQPFNYISSISTNLLYACFNKECYWGMRSKEFPQTCFIMIHWNQSYKTMRVTPVSVRWIVWCRRCCFWKVACQTPPRWHVRETSAWVAKSIFVSLCHLHIARVIVLWRLRFWEKHGC